MKTFEVELRRTSYVTLRVEADNAEEAEALAWQESLVVDSKHDSSWDVESIEEIKHEAN